jgi:hypothetical protein
MYHFFEFQPFAIVIGNDCVKKAGNVFNKEEGKTGGWEENKSSSESVVFQYFGFRWLQDQWENCYDMLRSLQE